MSYVVGTPISDTFILRDNSDGAITGKVAGDFVVIEAYLPPTGSPSVQVSLTEIGNGEYAFTFTPAAVGTWTVHILYNNAGVFREFQGPYGVLASSPQPVVTSATYGTTLQSLRRTVGNTLGDILICSTTQNSDTQTFIDPIHLRLPNNDYASWTAYCSAGDPLNVGQERTVTGSVFTSGSITVQPGFPANLLSGTELELHNERGIGWSGFEKNAAINKAIEDAAALGGVEITISPAGTFDQNVPTIAIPAQLTSLYLVEFQDVHDNWVVLSKAQRAGAQGWWVHASGGTIDIVGRWRYMAHGRPIRLRGYGQFAPLVNETDVTSVNVRYIEAAACLRLLQGGLDRDPARQVLIPLYKQDAEKWIRAATRVAPPNTTPVRGS